MEFFKICLANIFSSKKIKLLRIKTKYAHVIEAKCEMEVDNNDQILNNNTKDEMNVFPIKRYFFVKMKSNFSNEIILLNPTAPNLLQKLQIDMIRFFVFFCKITKKARHLA